MLAQMQNCWTCAALKDEITIINSEKYKKAITWSYALEALISAMQVCLISCCNLLFCWRTAIKDAFDCHSCNSLANV